MILAGLFVALGVVIDDVVVDMERLMRRLRSRGEATVATVVFEATLQTQRVALYATLIVVLAVRPSSSWAAWRGVLRAAGHRLPAGGGGIDAGRADRDAGAQPDAAGPQPAPHARVAAQRVAQERYEAALRRIVAAPAASLVAAAAVLVVGVAVAVARPVAACPRSRSGTCW